MAYLFQVESYPIEGVASIDIESRTFDSYEEALKAYNEYDVRAEWLALGRDRRIKEVSKAVYDMEGDDTSGDTEPLAGWLSYSFEQYQNDPHQFEFAQACTQPYHMDGEVLVCEFAGEVPELCDIVTSVLTATESPEQLERDVQDAVKVWGLPYSPNEIAVAAVAGILWWENL